MENQTPNANENVQPTAAQTELSRDEKKELYFNTTWVDIESKSTEDLTNLLKDIDGKVDFVDQKIFFNQAKDLIKTRAQEAKAKKLEAFLEAGNLAEDFDYQTTEFDEFYATQENYRVRRVAHFAKIEKDQSDSLKGRLALIEELKTLVDSNQNLKFSDFEELKTRWNSLGHINKSVSDDVYKTFHHHADRFFDLLSINRDLRDIEFNRNLKFKTELCEKAEALLSHSDPFEAVNELQNLHGLWKEQGGPVQKEHREVIWEKFNELSQQIHQNRQAELERREAEYLENFNKKMALVERVQNFPIKEINSHAGWRDQLKTLDEIRAEWKTIGRISREQNTISWEAFKEAVRVINSEKNTYYKNFKIRQQEALAVKRTLLEKAEELKESTDWKQTTEALKKLQNEWKNTAKPLVKEADEVWTKFRAACNHFFEKKEQHYNEQLGSFEDNLAKKKVLLEEVKALELKEDQHKENFDLLKSYNDKWRACGAVARKDREKTDGAFRSVMDTHFNKIKMEKNEKHEMLFKMKIDNFLEAKDFEAVKKERRFLKRKIDQIQDEIKQFEANMSWFGSGNNTMKQGIEKKIEQNKHRIKGFRSQVKLIDNLDIEH
ncbi:MAG: DUF349 domain-containing protein [Flavobacteriales bacterium]